MHRQFLQARDAFPKSANEHAQQVLRLLQHRRADLDASWEELEEGWEANNERMAEVGLRPRTAEESMVKLNVGGSNGALWWHLLAEVRGFDDSNLRALLEGVWGEGRIPRDADGRIVLDESSESFKHIMHRAWSGGAESVEEGQTESAASSAVAIDEIPCLVYAAHVLGLPRAVPPHPTYVQITEGSTVLEPFEIAPFGATVREWVGGSTAVQMTLVYRATRDGFDTKSFKPKCSEDCPHTFSLFRVSSGQGNDDDSVVGGYSVLPWGSGVESKQTITAETFVFMLKDGSATRKDQHRPVKWGPYPETVGQTFGTVEGIGACVVGNDLLTVLDTTTGGYNLFTGRETFDVEEDAPFLALQGKKIVDVEVYRYSVPDPPTTAAPSTTEPDGDDLTDAEAPDIDLFGRSIAISLTEERVVLDDAVDEMEAAGARVSAAVDALKTVYGPSVAAGEQDAVVELNVRGTRMTTLRSTLQACPRSALATMFDEERWPATDKDKDQHGGRLIDCDPICFAKILNVLRMRKRASWGRNVAGGEQEGEEEESRAVMPGGVLIKEADVEAFVEAVDMYFPGCESFIVDMVQSV